MISVNSCDVAVLEMREDEADSGHLPYHARPAVFVMSAGRGPASPVPGPSAAAAAAIIRLPFFPWYLP